MSEYTLPQDTAVTGQDTPAPAIDPMQHSGETPGQVENPDSATVSENDAENDAQNSEKNHKGGVQKRINELTREKKDAKREAEFWKKEALKNNASESQPAKQFESKQLDPADFPSYGDYEKAVVREEAKRIARDAHNEQTTQSKTESLVLNAFDKGKKKYSDFQDVVTNPEVPISQEVFNTVINLDDGADILYHLANNPDEALKLSRMNPYLAATEIGRLSAKLAVPAATPKTTTAPRPVPTIGTGGNSSVNPEKLSYEDYRKEREAGRI